MVDDTAPTGAYALNTDSGNKTPRCSRRHDGKHHADHVDPAFILTGETPRTGEPLRDAYGRMLTAHRSSPAPP
jgi:hypothetical protein